MICPKCLSKIIRGNTYQDTANSFNLSSTFKTSNQKSHGCLWWLTIGWWWELTKLSAKITFFFPRMILKLLSAPFKEKSQTESVDTSHPPVL